MDVVHESIVTPTYQCLKIADFLCEHYVTKLLCVDSIVQDTLQYKTNININHK